MGRLAGAARWVFVTVAFALASGSICRDAKAQQPPEPTATAAALFNEAKAMMDRGDNAQACPKLAESQAIDPQLGTMLNLALCYELVSKVASACAVWREAADAAARKVRVDREELARQRAAAICPRAPQVTVEIVDQPARGRLTVTINGDRLPHEHWGLPVAVDPGEYEVRAEGEGLEPWTAKVRIDEQQAQVVAVPVLAPLAPAASHAPGDPARPPPPLSGSDQQQSRVIGAGVWVLGGIGLAGLATSGAFGIAALSQYNTAHDGQKCVGKNCNAIGGAELMRASQYAVVSDVTLAAGLGALATGVVIWATAPKARPTSGTYVQPRVSANEWTLSIGSSW
jgi:hypothetical protein